MAYGFNLERLTQLLDEFGLPRPRLSGQSLLYDCPFCSKAKKLAVRRRDGRFACWSCRTTNGSEGDAERLLSMLFRITISDARDKLFGKEGPAQSFYLEPMLAEEVDEDEEVQWETLPSRSWEYHHYPIGEKGTDKGVAYLEGRGVSLEVAKQYGIRYSPIERRVIFPVEVGDTLVGWQGRLVVPHTWTDEQGVPREGMKVLSSPGIPRDRVLMFQNRIVGSHAVLTEGPFDAIKAHLCGGNVASMGKMVSRGQLDVLRKKGIKTLYLGLDPDAADDTMRIIRNFAFDLDVKLLEPPKGYDDLGDAPIEAVYEAFCSAPTVKPWRMSIFLG